ncbi:hypothetical protein BY996DRAFT_6446296 [Phakopsora pachyrhizi]|nr:hypothetical protein BY996DRAFT_6446296 [Phakopsora pachyrhizi]
MKFYFSPIAGRWDEKLEDVGSELEILPQTVSDSVMTRRSRHWAATAATDQSPLTSASGKARLQSELINPFVWLAPSTAPTKVLSSPFEADYWATTLPPEEEGRGEWTGGADCLLSEVHESNKKFVLRELKITN